jgi:glutamate-ammonia-ligase adenylyltransferase
MPKRVWDKPLSECADPARARQYWEQLLATAAGSTLRHASEAQVRVLAALFGGSQFLGELLVTHPDWILLALNPELLREPRQPQGLRRDLARLLGRTPSPAPQRDAWQQLRLFKQRELLRIATRDLSRLGSTMEITQELSDLADLCLDTVYRLLREQLTQKLGTPWHQDGRGNWQPTDFSVIALGKLGGQELNFSSDVDLVFVYSDEGFLFNSRPKKSDAGKGMTSHQFFTRLAKDFITEVTRLTDEGMLYRVDVRLRPEGDSGPLVRSLQSYENYYAQWGQAWERMMLVKARGVAGSASLADEFLELIQPFRYPRSLSERVIDDIGTIKDRIESEVVRAGELERNVKLGRGGIREIEFLTQTLQVLHAGRNPFLQETQTLPALQNLARYKHITRGTATGLAEAYCFLRDIEHRLQMENNLQTHTIPTDRRSRERLAALMGFDTLSAFEQRLHEHTHLVRTVYESMLKPVPKDTSSSLPADMETHEPEWKELLAARSFRDIGHAFKLLELFIHGPGYVHVSARTVELALRLVPILLSYCPIKPGCNTPYPAPPEGKALSDPDRVLARLDSFIHAYGTRAMLYETWTHNPSLFELLLLLFDRSEFLAEVAIRTPDLVDELQLSGRLRRGKTAAETLRELRFGLKDDDQLAWLRRYHQAEQMRIGLRDILGLADFESNLTEFSALADACLQYALEVVQQRHKLKKPPFVIIALGKLSGSEINYGSDLDLIFAAADETRDLASLQKYAVEVMELLSKPTEIGIVFTTDARLRPDGEKGLLVNTLKAYDDYFLQRAHLWEIQAFTRIRPVAGDMALGDRFAKSAARWTDFSQAKPLVAAYTPNWKQEMTRMRARIQKERTSNGQDELAIKTGTGGLMDAEFIAQMFALENGWQEPNTLQCLARVQAEEKLALAEADSLIHNYRQLRRIEGILRRWSFAGETVLPDDPAPLYRVAIRCGFPDSSSFLSAVVEYRLQIRQIFDQLLPSAA